MAEQASVYDVAVVGLGAMGAAALYQLAKLGAKAVGIDRHAPPHDQGSTHGETRITRQAIGEGVAYVPLALRSNEIWRELEAETGERLLSQIGCLIIGTMSPAASGPIRRSFLATTRQAAEDYGLAHEILSAEEIRKRFPQFMPLDGETGYFEPGGGYLDPERCVAAQLMRAKALGAGLRLGETVRSLAPAGGGVKIGTDGGTVYASKVIVSAGPWAPSLLGPPFSELLTPSRQVMHWFPVDPDWGSRWADGPVFIWAPGGDPRDFFYGFPSLPGSGTMKTAGEQYDEATAPETVQRKVAPAESQAMYEAHLAGRVRGIGRRAVRAVTCLYTVTPDSHFLIDRHPDDERIFVVSPCSGHGFKHSAAVGEAAAQMATEGRSRIDLSPFALSRFRSSPMPE
ncbi:N-methyl-L-tryptophan oxidase [Microvirga thermotolerans]|uniref:N-methyl-L-tryptophan oxidase n=1 Tax=Microvirga thermotolerans TaxID=2651334 RepID=A0A5P9JZX0_9HYPH|nr:N-methyl-L-tryptophan oxidase [Microvirga thermotolerans]QFU17711.1 N-methyl-L-tryptophan oxidase [Microvirga thermotolerans]